MKNICVKIISLMIACCMAVCCFTACNIPHVGNLGDDDDWNSVDWDSIVSSGYEETDYLEDIIYDICLFDANITDIKTVDVAFVEQKNVTTYFDEDKIYEKFGLRLDVNKLLTKFAVGTGVIVICLVFNVATAGTPVMCIATGALKGAITGAASGTIVGGIIGAISGYLTSNGDFADTLSGAIEGAVDGYMWGAIAGAISGAATSDYCFVAGTPVKTSNGYVPIETIAVGDEVWSYNHKTGEPEIKRVANVFVNSTSELTTVHTTGFVIEATPSHGFYLNGEYSEIGQAEIGDSLFSFDGQTVIIESLEYSPLDCEIPVYNFEVEDNHNYFVGDDEILVHNTCINEEYAGKTYKFESQLQTAQKTNDPNDWKLYNDLMAKYPNGVPYVRTPSGVYPDFDEYVLWQYTFDPVTPENLKAGTCLVGDSASGSPDFKLFRQKMLDSGYTKQQVSEILSTHTIHHHYDTRTLQLIPRDIHQAARHTGGASLIRQLIRAIL